MDYFNYKGNNLHAEGVSVAKLAKEFGTPLYIYSDKTLKRHYNAYADAFKSVSTLICYSIKANSNLAVINTLAKEGSGFDIVSKGELFRALKAGADPKKIVFSGVGKKRDEIEFALKKNILMFNVESPQELELINDVAGKLKKKAGIAIRINPDVDPKTHPYISTGLKKNKFGIEIKEAFKQYKYATTLKNINILGVDCHIGSQLTQIKPFIDAFKKVKDFVLKLKKVGIEIKYIDLGGGLGITYHKETPPGPDKYAKALIKESKSLEGVTLVFEPGRSIAGNAGILVSEVVYTKKGTAKNFVIVDAAMNDLARPSLYGSYHDIVPVKKNAKKKQKVDIVGPICETGDFLAQDRKLQTLEQGDLIVARSAGAYGFTMASNYNTRPRAAEVMVKGTKYQIVRKRETYDELTKNESVMK